MGNVNCWSTCARTGRLFTLPAQACITDFSFNFKSGGNYTPNRAFYVRRKRLLSEALAMALIWLTLGLVAVDGVHGEGGEADGDIFGAAFVRSGVTDPFTGVSDDGLSGSDVEGSGFVLDVEGAFEDYGEFVEGRSLAGFEPSGGAAHVSDAAGGGLGVDTSDVFVDELGFVAGGLDAGGLRD
jgi:hypothetical protein